MNRKSLILGLLAILGISLSGAILTSRIASQSDVILELRREIDELKEIQSRLEEENECLSDELQSCTEDYQHCVSGRIWTETYPNPSNK
jgi:type II secretory pathway pseudopilin PulG